ncbi:MAG: AAA family ATPase [Desulfococcaceae bacterium]
MYETFFGFKERPFQLVPNPAYLFLGRSHEEALAHLTYAVRQGDGFVEITGEVGTGKTTLCRVFLENLDETVEAAYIFNPMLTPRELLHAVLDELGIEAAPEADVKILIDRLNVHLMKRRREGRRVLLLIDEAQNLSRDVLEQLRLLSNLETRTHKLIQIILVGQPELRDLLGSHELRQLGQRITLSCHLTPFHFRETMDYIRHRIQIASRKPGVRFTRAAYRVIHDYSGGVPRLINIACDRAMLTAYGLNRRKITGGMARTAIRELGGRNRRRGPAPTRHQPRIALVPVLLAVVAGAAGAVFLDRWPVRLPFGERGEASLAAPATVGTSVPTPEGAETPEVAALESPSETAETAEDAQSPAIEPAAEVPSESADSKAPADEPAAAAETAADATAAEAPIAPEDAVAPTSEVLPPSAVQKPPPSVPPVETPSPAGIADFGGFLSELSSRESRREALLSVVRRWEPEADLFDFLDGIPSAEEFFRTATRRHALELLNSRKGMEILRNLNLPAVLELRPPEAASPVYLALIGVDGDSVVLDSDRGPIRMSGAELGPYWSGQAFVPWRNFYGLEGIIPRNAPDDAVVTLKMMLRDIGFADLEPTAVFDEKTRQAIQYLQEKHQVAVDGAVGPQTKIILYNELAEPLSIPRLRSESESTAGLSPEERPL